MALGIRASPAAKTRASFSQRFTSVNTLIAKTFLLA
jgi:hypothetical protein